MPDDKIRVLIVDSVEDTRESIRKLLNVRQSPSK